MREFFQKHGLPFLLIVAAFALAALLGDVLLHELGLGWIGRYLGIPGVLLIALSLVYSLRKRGRSAKGATPALLRWHEWAAWLGSLLVLIHSGVHFNAVLPWLATFAMGVNVISGLVGKFLLKHAREHLLPDAAAGDGRQETLPGAMALDAISGWRRVHIPVSVAFSALALGHIFSIFLFWGWR